MLKFLIIQIVKEGNAKIKLEWTEDLVLLHMKSNMPANMHIALEKAWNKVTRKFKEESVKVK